MEDKLSKVTLAFGKLYNKNNQQLEFGGVVKRAYPEVIFFPSSGIKRGTLAHEAVHVGQLAGLIERVRLDGPSHLADKDFGPELKKGVLFSKLNAEEQAEWVEQFAKNPSSQNTPA